MVLVGNNEQLVVFGGWKYSTQVNVPHEFYNDVYIFHIRASTWVQIETFGEPPRPRCQTPCWHLPSPHCHPSFSSSSGYLVLFGGACHSNTHGAVDNHHNFEMESGEVMDLEDMFILDLDTHTWLPFSFTFPRYADLNC